MKMMSKSPARGYSQSRLFGGGTLVAGKSLFLPTERVPVVVQSLTRDQIAAIPKDVFSVKVLGLEKSVGVRGAIQIARAISPDRKMGVVVRGSSAIGGVMAMRGESIMQGVKLIKGGPLTVTGTGRPVRKLSQLAGGGRRASSGGLPVRVLGTGGGGGGHNKDDGEKLVAILERFKENCKQLQDYTDNRRPTAPDDGDGGNLLPKPTNIFLPALSEIKIADAVHTVIKSYFGLNKICMLSGKECKLAEFCLLMFIVFDRMHILVNHARKPFCVFLQTEVFMSDKILQVKTFNNYANNPKFKSFDERYKDTDFDLNNPPSSNAKYYELACHEIGIAFQNTEYFKQVCDLRTTIQKIYVTH